MGIGQAVKKFIERRQLTYTPGEQKISRASQTIGWVAIGFASFACLVLLMWASGIARSTSANETPNVWAIFGADLLVALAAAAAGSLFGFVFGIPRTLNPADRAAVASAASQEGASGKTHALMAANTNLERISDWLTTLLIGATLVQIKEIATWVGSLGKNLVKSGPLGNEAIVPVIIILFFSLAFLVVYLITRLYLTTALMQTLGFLTRTNPDQAEADLAKLNAAMESALKSGKPDEMASGLKIAEESKLSEADRADPALNANMARLLAKLIKAGATADRTKAIEKLRAAIDKAMKSAEIGRALKKDFDTGEFATGDEALDNEIKAKLPA